MEDAPPFFSACTPCVRISGEGGREGGRNGGTRRETAHAQETRAKTRRRDGRQRHSVRRIKRAGWIGEEGAAMGPDRLEIKRNNGSIFFGSPASSPQARFLVANKNRSRAVAINIPRVRPLGLGRHPRSYTSPRIHHDVSVLIFDVCAAAFPPVLRASSSLILSDADARRSARRSGHPL